MPSKVIGDLVARLEAQTDRFNRELERTRQFNKRFERQVTASDRALRGMGSTLRSLLPALSVAAIVDLTRRTIELGAATSRTARFLGLAVEDYTALRFAAQQNGIAQGQFDQALQRVIRRIGEVSQGNGELLSTFEALGIEVRDANGNIRPTLELLVEYAQVVQQVEGRQQQLAVAFKAFDSEGARLLLALPQLAQGMDLVRDAAEDAGVVIETRTAQSLERAHGPNRCVRRAGEGRRDARRRRVHSTFRPRRPAADREPRAPNQGLA